MILIRSDKTTFHGSFMESLCFFGFDCQLKTPSKQVILLYICSEISNDNRIL